MVDIAISQHNTDLSSSISGTPLLTINRDATLDADSSNAFEGPEKLLEVWFAPSAADIPASTVSNGLKGVPAAAWTEMLDLVHCKVLSVVKSEQVDAYLLSESSMFVFPHKLVLKTCGITTLLFGLPKILEIAALCAGFPHKPAFNDKLAAAQTHRVFYSRKNFLFPDQQQGPHRSWLGEVNSLEGILGSHGSAYQIGKMNGDHWYLYVTAPDNRFTPPITPEHERLDQSTPPETRMLDFPERIADLATTRTNCDLADDTEDETLEILMTDLDQENAKQFCLDHASAVAEDQYFKETHKKNKKDMGDALGSFAEDLNSADHYDVFEQTSSDNAALFTPDEEDHSLPEALTTEGHALGKLVSDSSGLSNVYPTCRYPDARIDAYLFTPCGFSANGVIPAPPSDDRNATASKSSTHYFNVHVTPEPQCSYASFETNVPSRQTGRETVEVIQQVVEIFKPGRFSVTLFEGKSNGQGAGSHHERRGSSGYTCSKMDAIKGYRRMDRIVHDLDGYDLVFQYFERHDWKGGAPRLGERF
ncbi:MAG: spermidine resistance protein [Chrysothrix sp. TS-e1954]|nr:MAG: spermidine resistance protein [Chrysothrix sp. TS-e1954]